MKKILVVDDCSITAAIIEDMIASSNSSLEWEVIKSHSVNEAIDIINHNDISILFQDLHVEDTNDGLRVAAVAKEKEVYVCMITAEQGLDLLKAMVKHETNRVILKPITTTSIRSVLRDFKSQTH